MRNRQFQKTNQDTIMASNRNSLRSIHRRKLGWSILFPVLLCGGLLPSAQSFAQERTADRVNAPASVPADDLFARGNALYAKGEFAKALLIYRRAEQRGAERAAAAFNQGNCLFQLNRFPEAAAAYKKAVRYSNGKLAPAQLNLAAVLFRMEQYGEAIAAYRRVVREDPENVSAWLYLADASSRVKDYAGALRAMERARALDSEDATLVYQTAEIHAAMKEYDDAVALVRQAFALKPTEVDFLFYAGDLRRAQGKFGEAATAYREGLALRPEDTDALYKLADALARDGKPFLAMDPLQQALAIKPDYSDAAVFLGNLAFDAQWWERSEAAYRQALENKNREGLEGLRNLAFEFHRQGRNDAAADLLVRTAKLVPGNAELEAEITQYRELSRESDAPKVPGTSGNPK
jgi:tetratricopeptide (TPR) repeat protein